MCTCPACCLTPRLLRAPRRIVRVDLKFPSDRVHVSEGAEGFIRALLVKDPAARLNLADVPSHPWIVANADPAVLSGQQ